MTPIRAGIVMYGAAIASIFGRCLGMDVLHVYISVSPTYRLVQHCVKLTSNACVRKWLHSPDMQPFMAVRMSLIS